MTKIQELELAINEKRQEIRALAMQESLTEEEEGKLDAGAKELSGMEKRYSAFLVTEEKPTEPTDAGKPEDAEKRALIQKCDIGVIMKGAVEARGRLDGPEGEVQQEYGCGPNEIPFVLLEKEVRAVTPAPSNVERAEAEVVLPVFSDSLAAFLGISMPNPASGEASYPVLTSRPTVGGPHDDSTSVSETTGAFSAESLGPERLQCSFFYRRGDSVKFPGMGDALRSALRSGLVEALDKEVIAGAAGLLTGTNLANNNSSAVAVYADYVSSLGFSRVDGRYVRNASELRLVMGSRTYAHAGGVYRATEADRSALDRLMGITAGVAVSVHTPAVGATKKQNAIVRLGSAPGAVLPVWGSGVGLIVDEITKSATGEISVVAYIFMNFKITRSDVFHKQQFQLVA